MSAGDWALLWLAVVVGGILILDFATGSDVATDALGDLDPSAAPDPSTGAASSSSPAATILAALASFENVASQHNNPGAICGSFDASGNCLGPKTFATLAEGTAAGVALVAKYLVVNPTITVADFVKKWSGATGQVLSNYTNSVSSALGLDPSDPISDAGGGDDASSDGDDDD